MVKVNHPTPWPSTIRVNKFTYKLILPIIGMIHNPNQSIITLKNSVTLFVQTKIFKFKYLVSFIFSALKVKQIKLQKPFYF